MSVIKRKFHALSAWIGGHHRLSIAFVLSMAAISLLLAFGFVFRSGSNLVSKEAYQYVLDLQKDQLHTTVHNFVQCIDLERHDLKEEHPDWSQEQIDARVKQLTYQHIHELEFNAKAYMSIKKILDYNGGSRYAISIANPYNPAREGTPLSTELTDPYEKQFFKDELDDLRQYGNSYQTHSFTDRETGKIRERLSYSELYPDYDWVVSMSVDTDNLQQYTQRTERHIIPTLRNYMILFFLLILGLVLLTIFFILHTDQKYFGTQQKELQQQINWDTLTSAHSRKYGTELLERECQNVKSCLDACDTAVMMLDVDHFKEFNDTYGHAVGDAVLREVVLAIRRVSRSSDRIIRWGGDEFIGIFYGLKRSHTELMMEKIQRSIEQIHINAGNADIHISVSMGFAFFKPSDSSIAAVLERADAALYEAKKAGRSQGRTAE